MAPRKIIIDTDPGVDDVLAMLLAFSALPEELEVLLVSVTYGNIDVQNCLRNVVSMFSHIEKEIAWREANGRPLGFDTLRKNPKPLVAVGPEEPLADQILMADYFHGRDGLGGISETHPHLSPSDTWKELFTHTESSADPEDSLVREELQKVDTLFTPSKRSGSDEILRLLREHEPDTITIVAVGPLTNLALAATRDPTTFLCAKEVVVMGGAVSEPGNMTPVAEFNTFADAFAAARVYALSSPNPNSTIPPVPPHRSHSDHAHLTPYPPALARRLNITLFPLDITHQHLLTRGSFGTTLAPLLAQHSPLAEWVSAFVSSTFHKVESLASHVAGDSVALELHDPLCVWYAMTDPLGWRLSDETDLRVETAGQWTRGMCVVDRRPRQMREEGDDGEKPGDTGNWLSRSSGNRLRVAEESPGKDRFGAVLLERIFALQ